MLRQKSTTNRFGTSLRLQFGVEGSVLCLRHEERINAHGRPWFEVGAEPFAARRGLREALLDERPVVVHLGLGLRVVPAVRPHQRLVDGNDGDAGAAREARDEGAPLVSGRYVLGVVLISRGYDVGGQRPVGERGVNDSFHEAYEIMSELCAANLFVLSAMSLRSCAKICVDDLGDMISADNGTQSRVGGFNTRLLSRAQYGI